MVRAKSREPGARCEEQSAKSKEQEVVGADLCVCPPRAKSEGPSAKREEQGARNGGLQSVVEFRFVGATGWSPFSRAKSHGDSSNL